VKTVGRQAAPGPMVEPVRRRFQDKKLHKMELPSAQKIFWSRGRRKG